MALPDLPAEVSWTDKPSFILSKDACETIHANETFPEWVDESRDYDIDPNELDELFAAVGWESKGEIQWRQDLKESMGVISLRHKDLLIGFGRMRMDDNGKVMLYDGIIRPHPMYRGIGLFKTMLIKAEKELESEGIETAYLVAEDGTETIYRHLGLKAIRNGSA